MKPLPIWPRFFWLFACGSRVEHAGSGWKEAGLRRVLIAALLLSAVASAPQTSFAAGDREKYDLQERCGKRAREQFQKDFGDGRQITNWGEIDYSYESNYNERSNKCVMVYTKLYVHDDAHRGKTTVEKDLFDANTNKQYGHFIQYGYDVQVCYVGSSRCGSMAEWTSLTKPYMDDTE